MNSPVKRRRYDASGRRAAAEQNRHRVLAAARDLFASRGFHDTPVAAIAAHAGVSIDTVYASVGRKPQLLLAVHDLELAGGPEPVQADQRDYVRAILETPTARGKLEVYARALAVVLPRTVPLQLALRTAALNDRACQAVVEQIAERRAVNMTRLAADLRTTGELRKDLSDERVAQVLWSMNSPDYYELMRGRGLGPDEYADLVLDVWCRTFLA